MNENPFILFKNTVNVLVVDDMPLITRAVQEFLEMFKIYTVNTANSTKEAMDITEKTEKRYHACLFDLGMNDVACNEFHLLDTYKKNNTLYHNDIE
jgi:DNA-binding NtrC family response regulator